jgi:carbamoylphosphate synthase large subunit
MKSVGEAMAIGRTFKESLQKCLRSLEYGGRAPAPAAVWAATANPGASARKNVCITNKILPTFL